MGKFSKMNRFTVLESQNRLSTSHNMVAECPLAWSMSSLLNPPGPYSPALRNACRRRSNSGSCKSSGPISPEEDDDDSAGGCVAVAAVIADRTALTEAVRVRRDWGAPALVGAEAADEPEVEPAVECRVPISKSSSLPRSHGCSFSC